MVTHATLAEFSEKPWNDIVVDERGNAYVNGIGYDFPGGEPAPGLLVLVTPQGDVRKVAEDLSFPNGMAITADGATLIVAESHGNRLTAYAIDPNGDWPTGESGQEPGTTTRTGSVSMPTAPSGMPTSRTDTACECARAGMSSRRST